MRKLGLTKRFVNAISLGALLIFISGFGYVAFQNLSLRQRLENKDSVIRQKEEEAAAKEEEIRLCLEDRAKIVDSYTEPYSFSEFGIYSPLFSDKEVETTTYLYNRKTINHRRIVISEDKDKDSALKAEVWEFAYEQWGPEALYETYESREVKIFGWMSKAISLSEIREQWREEYVNTNSMKMNWYFGYSNFGVVAVYLEFMSQYSPSGNPIFIRLSIDNLFAEDTKDLEVVEARRRLEEFADTVDFRIR